MNNLASTSTARRFWISAMAPAAIMLLALGEAHADDNGVVFVSGGGQIGLAVHGDDNGLLLGGEVSAGYAHSFDDAPDRSYDIGTFAWAGAYGDVVRDLHTDTTRVSFGPELGIKVAGLDGGLIHETGDMARWGWTIRPSITYVFATAFVRYVNWNEGAEPSHWEGGLLFKLPVPLDRLW